MEIKTLPVFEICPLRPFQLCIFLLLSPNPSFVPRTEIPYPPPNAPETPNMPDPDPFFSNGTCYYGPGNEVNEQMLPCGKAALGHKWCCQQGHICTTEGVALPSGSMGGIAPGAVTRSTKTKLVPTS